MRRFHHLFAWPASDAASPDPGLAAGHDQVLHEARLLARVQAPDNLAWQDDHLLLSSGHDILVIGDIGDGNPQPERILRFEDPVSALASASDGTLAVGLGRGGLILVGGAHDGLRLATVGGQALICPTALAFAGPDMLYLCQGSAFHEPETWQRDLLEPRPSGTIWRIDLTSGAADCIGQALSFPSGLLLLDGGRQILVSEGRGHRLLVLDATRHAGARVVLDELPGYPGRLAPAAGGAWLSVFTPRGRRTSDLACGLVLRLDADYSLIASLHGLPEDERHDVTSCLEVGGELVAACREDDVLVAIEIRGDGGIEGRAGHATTY